MLFKPIIWLQKRKNYIGLTRELWLHLITYRAYIQACLDQYDFFLDSFKLLDDQRNEHIQLDFVNKNGRSYLVLIQGKNKIKLDSEAWRSICRNGIFLTSFICWNNILRKQIAHFYYNYYIPTCAALKKTNVLVSEIPGFNEPDIEIDLLRLCYEFSKKMPHIIKQDIKIYNLIQRMENK